MSTYNGIKISVVVMDTHSYITGMSRVAEEVLELTACDVSLLGVLHSGGGGQRQQYMSIIGRVAPRAVTVDLNAVLKKYGGGGHPKASAASVRLTASTSAPSNATRSSSSTNSSSSAATGEASRAANPEAIREGMALMASVRREVQSQIPNEVTAEDIMTNEVVFLEPDQTVDEARAVLNDSRLRGAPVVDPASGRLVGLIKFSDVVRAAQGGKAAHKIKGIVRANVPTVNPEMPFAELETFIMERGIGRLPVVSSAGKVIGIITRTDILRHHNLYSSLNDPDRAERRAEHDERRGSDKEADTQSCTD